jgi:hypothetical protein
LPEGDYAPEHFELKDAPQARRRRRRTAARFVLDFEMFWRTLRHAINEKIRLDCDLTCTMSAHASYAALLTHRRQSAKRFLVRARRGGELLAEMMTQCCNGSTATPNSNVQSPS